MSGLTVTAPASLSKTVSKSKRGRGYGMFMAVWSLGQLIGPLIGGYLAETTNYTVPFYVSSVIALIIPVMALRLKEKKNQSTNKVLKPDGEAKQSLFNFSSLK